MNNKDCSQYKLLKSGIDNRTLDSLKKNKNSSFALLYSSFNNRYPSKVEISAEISEILVKISSTKILLRLDAYLFLYYYVCNAIPFELIYDKVKDIKPEITLKADFFNSTFLLQTSLDSSEILIMNIDKMEFMYQNAKDETFPYGTVFVHINEIESKVASKHQERNFFQTKSDFTILRVSISPKESPSEQDSIRMTDFFKIASSILRRELSPEEKEKLIQLIPSTS